MEPPTIQVIITIEPGPGSSREAREVFRWAVDEFRPYLLRLAARELGSDLRPKGDASDLVQQTCLEAHRDLGSFAGRTEAEFRRWLRRILFNNLKHHARRYRDTGKRDVDREVPLVLPGIEPERPADRGSEPEADSTSPSGRVIGRERAHAVREALSRLSDRSLRSVLGRARDERTFEAIGRDLGCSAVAARNICRRAFARLRRDLKALARDSTSQFPQED